VKYSAAAIVPFIWFCRPAARRGLVVGAGIAAAIALLSALLAPGVWQDWIGTLGSQSALSLEGSEIIYILPTTGADFALRLFLAALLVVGSVWLRSPHLAYVATLVALPTIWIQKMAALFALLTLEDDKWVRNATRRDRVSSSP
jgi:hypothetical protein